MSIVEHQNVAGDKISSSIILKNNQDREFWNLHKFQMTLSRSSHSMIVQVYEN